MTKPEPVDEGALLRLRLDIAYDGTDFSGWARQPGLRTVQGCLESALAVVLRAPPRTVTCAGRTDAGVHARGQVAHVDVEEPRLLTGRAPSPQRAAEALTRRLNSVLDDDLRVRACALAPAGFDARFGALWRGYAYRVCDRLEQADPLLRRQVWMRPVPLDVEAMDAAASALRGEHDFAAFCRARAGATTVRDLQVLTWRRESAGLAVLTVRADAFCHHMVRGLAGALIAVGEGRRSASWTSSLLTATGRDSTVAVAPPHGLTLEEVGYPPADALADRATRTRARRAPVNRTVQR